MGMPVHIHIVTSRVAGKLLVPGVSDLDTPILRSVSAL